MDKKSFIYVIGLGLFMTIALFFIYFSLCKIKNIVNQIEKDQNTFIESLGK
jgi:hypothetical protein